MVLGGDVLIVHNKSILAFQCSSLWVLFAVTRILSGMEIISTLLMTPFISQNLESLGSDLELINSALSVIISPLIDGSPGITDLVLYWVSFLRALLSSYISSFSISGLWLTHHQCTKFLQETLPDVGVLILYLGHLQNQYLSLFFFKCLCHRAWRDKKWFRCLQKSPWFWSKTWARDLSSWGFHSLSFLAVSFWVSMASPSSRTGSPL